jgi:tRNA-dihydrouridine synthase
MLYASVVKPSNRGGKAGVTLKVRIGRIGKMVFIASERDAVKVAAVGIHLKNQR